MDSPFSFLPLKVLKKGCGKDIKSALEELEKEGRVLSRGKKYAIPERVNCIEGIFDGKKDGYGFVMPDTDMKDLFIPPQDTYTALDGDLVLAEKRKKERGRWIGRIVRIIKREKEFFVGQIVRIENELMFEPGDKNIPHRFEIENKEQVKEGEWVLVKFLKWTTPHLLPLVSYAKTLNKNNIYDAIIKQEFHLQHGFPKTVITEANNIPSLKLDKREDLTHLTTITIDPFDAKDFDDALSIKKEGGNYHLWVHISDVSSIIKRGSAIDEEAAKRGCSIYLPQDTFFMLPQDLTARLSLKEREIRPAITIYIIFNRKGIVKEKKVYQSIISTDKRFSYQETQDILDGKITSGFSKDLKLMSELADILEAMRDRQGYLSFAKKEVEIKFEGSEPEDILLQKQLWTHRIIEQFMIHANEAVAERLYANKMPAIFRTHEEPDEKKLHRFKELTHFLGFNLRSTRRRDLSNFLGEIKGSPYERILNYELLRCMKRARYIAQAEPHYGLASRLYTHFTSPIRRYPDQIVHRILLGEQYSRDELEEIATHSTEQEWKADGVERGVTNLYILCYLEKNKWKDYRGMIVDIAPDGVWVELEKYLISGFLPIRLLPPDDYKIKNNSFKGRRHSFTIGDILAVKIYSVSPIIRKLQLDYAGKVKKINYLPPNF